MSPENNQNPPRGTSQPSEDDEYGPYPTSTYPHYSSVRSIPVPTSQRDEDGGSEEPSAGMTSSGVALSPLEKWAVNASPSQFNALAGAIGGFTSGVVTCPLDVIKTKLQAQGGFNPVSKGRHVGHPKLYDGLTGTARVIWRDEGIRGMYRGLGPIVLGYLPTWAVWFTVYNNSKDWLRNRHENPFVISFWSSIIAGASSTIVTNPIWVIKTRLMSQSVAHRTGQHYTQFPKSGNTPTSRPTLSTPWHYNSTLDAARKMYTSEGILSFYSGLTPALLGLTHVAVQFPAYEFLKTQFTGQGMGAPLNGESPSSHWIGVLSASILSKILASSATYPHEVVRTRLQTQRRPVAGAEYLQGLGIKISSSATPEEVAAHQKQVQPPAPKYRGVVMTFRTILAEEGWRAFYAGMGTNMMRAVPAATVTMLTYEFFMEQFNHIKAEGRRKLGHEDVPLDASL
ncbi:Mitochondrial nicotinamide adenine dinucleotide transporter 1 like protein [Verticillium longisporum]|uniref:Mitochondrial nicotinamide adenine dinucleotide transporter 1 like protein n=1 Tax=Verticillium longisporum TaxID=100787 RepID=A0A8I2ZC12_VERLO|nr:Mitochondrial nicotinamide adenine dinucleotide transporter 1 like protein [Verticillium longisporum]KAG7127421.1 Mitochondrial nicotinamide adenine dinucleotide transporter 1 like protein [Verticillium longisporum]